MDGAGAEMRALVLEGFGRMVLTRRAIPAPGPGEMLVRVLATGICGSDVHGFTGENGRRAPGQVMGHETVGVVVAGASDPAGPPAGTVVVVNPTLACGACRRCQQGRANVCATRRVIGVDPAIMSWWSVVARSVRRWPWRPVVSARRP